MPTDLSLIHAPRSRAHVLAALFGGLFALMPLALAAQLAVATHGVNLRPNHSTHNAPLRAITEGDTLALLATDTTNGYLHVRTMNDGTEGWVYNRYVTVVSAGGNPAPSPPSPPGAVTSAPANYDSCANAGVNKTGNTPNASIQALNLLKNRYTAPAGSDIDSAITLNALLKPGDDDGRFDESKGAIIVAVVTDVIVGGVETTNCEATAPMFRDTHIRIARTVDAPESERVVVEVTPRWRAAMAAAGVDWSTATLAGTLVGKRVRVRGWMLFDWDHKSGSRNLDPADAKKPTNWRATVWEIHPITSLEVVAPP